MVEYDDKVPQEFVCTMAKLPKATCQKEPSSWGNVEVPADRFPVNKNVNSQSLSCAFVSPSSSKHADDASCGIL